MGIDNKKNTISSNSDEEIRLVLEATTNIINHDTLELFNIALGSLNYQSSVKTSDDECVSFAGLRTKVDPIKFAEDLSIRVSDEILDGKYENNTTRRPKKEQLETEKILRMLTIRAGLTPERVKIILYHLIKNNEFCVMGFMPAEPDCLINYINPQLMKALIDQEGLVSSNPKDLSFVIRLPEQSIDNGFMKKFTKRKSEEKEGSIA